MSKVMDELKTAIAKFEEASAHPGAAYDAPWEEINALCEAAQAVAKMQIHVITQHDDGGESIWGLILGEDEKLLQEWEVEHRSWATVNRDVTVY